MSIELVTAPTLNVTYSDPNLKSKVVGIQSAQWRGTATVRVRNEPGKTWRIGFVQVLEKSVFTLLYTKSRVDEVLMAGKSLPILDGSKNLGFRPFYDKTPNTKDVQTPAGAPVGTAPTVVVTMWDEPESPYAWWHNNDETDPLEEVVMNLHFTTSVAARDITNGAAAPQQLTLLRQWNVILDRRYTFTPVKSSSSTAGSLRADLTQTRWSVENPSKQPFITNVGRPTDPPACVWMGETANQVFTDVATTRAAKVVGASIRNIAARFGGV